MKSGVMSLSRLFFVFSLPFPALCVFIVIIMGEVVDSHVWWSRLAKAQLFRCNGGGTMRRLAFVALTGKT